MIFHYAETILKFHKGFILPDRSVVLVDLSICLKNTWIEGDYEINKEAFPFNNL